jgi:hypothetical protein
VNPDLEPDRAFLDAVEDIAARDAHVGAGSPDTAPHLAPDIDDDPWVEPDPILKETKSMSLFGSPISKALGALLVAAVAVAVQWLDTGAFSTTQELVTAITGLVSAVVVYVLRNGPSITDRF